MLVVRELDLFFQAHHRAVLVKGEFTHEDLQEVVLVAIASVRDPLSVRREKRTAVIAWRTNHEVPRAGLHVPNVDVTITGLMRGIEKMPAIRTDGTLGLVGVLVALKLRERRRKLAVNAGLNDSHARRIRPLVLAGSTLIAGRITAQWLGHGTRKDHRVRIRWVKPTTRVG